MDQSRNLVRMMAGVGVVLMSLVIVNAFFYREEVVRDLRALVRHTHEVKSTISAVSNRVRDLELGQRGYFITRDSAFLEPYWLALGVSRNGKPSSRSLLDQVSVLDSLVARTPRQTEHVARLHTLIDAKLDFVDSTLGLFATAGDRPAFDAIRAGGGKRIMDSIRAVVGAMGREEDSLLAERTRVEENELRENGLLLYGTVSFLYLVSLLGLWLASRQSSRRRRVERALKDSHQFLTAVIDGTDYAVLAFDSEGTLKVYSAGAERMLGYKASGEIGSNVGDSLGKVMLPPEREARIRGLTEQYGRPPRGVELFTRGLDTDGPYGQEWTYRRKNGTLVSVAQRIFPLEDGGFIAFGRDITRIKALERDLRESGSRLQAVIDGIDYAIFATDSKGMLRLINRGAERILGYSVTEMVGRPVNELAARFADPSELRARASRLGKHYGRQVNDIELISLPLPDDGPFGQEWTHVRPDGVRVTLAFSVYTLTGEDGEHAGVVALARDITQLKALDRMKSEFISTVSHELRTPLTSIRGALGLVSGGAVGALSEKAAELVTIAHRNSERLVHIINDILDIEKIESGKLSMHPQPIAADEFLRQALEANRAYGERYGVNFVIKDVEPGATVMADPDRLMQVMANLLSNAAKFSPRASEVWVSARTTGGFLQVSVRDFGSGISDDFRERVFEKFAQAEDSSTRRRDGTGLGLSITRKLVEAMQGRIEFSTAAGRGTEFRFTIPLVGPEGAAASEPFPEGAKESILVCEDDRDVSQLLKLILERSGFAVEVAYSLSEARQKLQAREYAAMTLDLVLPDGSGVDFLKELRADARWIDLPVVVLSARAEEGRRELNGDAIGMIDWMIKPIDEGVLVRALRGVVSGISTRKPRILHVEDDADLRAILARSLADQVEWRGASTVGEAEALLRREPFDLVVLDLALPDGSGLDLLERLNRLTGTPVPVLILSASEAEQQVRARVEAVLVKSRMSEERIVQTILAVIHKHAPG